MRPRDVLARNVSGSFARDPTQGRGAVAALDDEISALQHTQADFSSTI